LRVEEARRRIVDHASGALVWIFDVASVSYVVARQTLGPGIEERASLNDDAGARATVFVAADLNGAIAVVDHRLPFGLVGLGIRGPSRQSQGSDQNERRADSFNPQGILDPFA
jgi:hypothetical protein